jgi:hypothetical protein
MLSVIYAECCKRVHNAQCHYAECHYAECHYAECHYAECRGAAKKDEHTASTRLGLIRFDIQRKSTIIIIVGMTRDHYVRPYKRVDQGLML